MCCRSSNDVFRRHRTWWQLCSGTDDLLSHSDVTLECESSLWLKDQRQRTVHRANVNHVSNAEFQKARNGMTTMFVKRQSKITSKTTLDSRTTHNWQVLQAQNKSLLSTSIGKRQRNFQRKGPNALVTMHSEGAEYNESYISEKILN